MERGVASLLRDRKGATAIEYGLIASLIVIAIMAALIAMASKSTGIWNKVSTEVSRA